MKTIGQRINITNNPTQHIESRERRQMTIRVLESFFILYYMRERGRKETSNNALSDSLLAEHWA